MRWLILAIITAAQADDQVCLYEHPNYRGWEQCFTEDQANFKYLRINDQVSSLKIFGNIQVKLYQHANYQGFVNLYTRDTAWVGEAADDQFSSLQILPGFNDQVCLYEHPRYAGFERCFTEDQPNFAYLGINDQVSSLRISGNLEVNLFQHSNYRGFRQVYRNDTPWVGRDVDEQFSSIQIVKIPPSSPKQPHRDWNDNSNWNHEPRHHDERQSPDSRYHYGNKRLRPPPPEAPPSDHYFQLRVQGKCLTALSLHKDGIPLQTRQCEDNVTQWWTWERGRLVNRGGKCLDADSGSMNQNGGRLQIWECHDRANQQWFFDGNRVVNKGSGKCLDLHSGHVQLWECNEDLDQQWEH